MTDSIDHVGRGRGPENLWRHDAHGCRHVFQFRIARHARHRQLVQLQMAIEHVRRVLCMSMFIVMILCCHCHTYTQQWQNDVFRFHSVFMIKMYKKMC